MLTGGLRSKPTYPRRDARIGRVEFGYTFAEFVADVNRKCALTLDAVHRATARSSANTPVVAKPIDSPEPGFGGAVAGTVMRWAIGDFRLTTWLVARARCRSSRSRLRFACEQRSMLSNGCQESSTRSSTSFREALPSVGQHEILRLPRIQSVRRWSPSGCSPKDEKYPGRSRFRGTADRSNLFRSRAASDRLRVDPPVFRLAK